MYTVNPIHNISNMLFQLLEEGGQSLDVSIDDVVELLRGNRVKSSEPFQTDAMSILNTTINDILVAVKGKSPLQVRLYMYLNMSYLIHFMSILLILLQILEFLRCGVMVDDKEVVAVVLTDIAESLTYSISEIRGVLDGKYGKMAQKDFLRKGANVPIIQRKKNDRKRRSFVFFTQFIPSDLLEQLKNGKYVGEHISEKHGLDRLSEVCS